MRRGIHFGDSLRATIKFALCIAVLFPVVSEFQMFVPWQYFTTSPCTCASLNRGVEHELSLILGPVQNQRLERVPMWAVWAIVLYKVRLTNKIH